MPLYEYQCEGCGHRFERIQKFSDPPVEVCPNCGERSVQKLLSSPAIQFKGSGWYVTDYAKKSGTSAGKSEKSDKSEGGSDGKSESTPEAKSEAKTESKPESSSSSESKSPAPAKAD